MHIYSDKKLSKKLRPFLFMALCASMPLAFAHFGPIPMSLKDVPIPEVPGLTDGPDPIVVDKDKAIVLGKALFWDVNVGSDGIACASCHFHAGADSRIKNQLSPVGKVENAVDEIFDLSPDGTARGSNYQLKRSDFPFYQTENPLLPNSPVIYSSDDVVSSSGTFGGEFRDVTWFGSQNDNCDRSADPVFHVGAIGTRRVEPRHTPTVINSVFNHRNFWDGRANNVFNGSSPWGDRDPDAGVWVNSENGLVKERLHLINSSLASQAIAPPIDDIEMGCNNRRFADLGRKLMWRKPLEKQNVHFNDSVLGSYSLSTELQMKRGLNTFYYWLVRSAFNPKYWNSSQRGGELGMPAQYNWRVPLAYDQYEANFGMFFALSIQLYLSTLVSDDSPFDRSARDEQGLPTELTAQETEGLAEFRVAHCSLCHIGPLMTSAAIVTNAELAKTNPEIFGNDVFSISTSENVITRMSLLHENENGEIEEGGALFDTGFANTGVSQSNTDISLGGVDPFGFPFSFAEQYIDFLAGNHNAVIDKEVATTRACDFDIPLAKENEIPLVGIFTQNEGIIPQPQDNQNCYNLSGAFIPTQQAVQSELANPTGKLLLGTHGSFKVPTLRNIDLTGPYMHNGGMATLEEVVEFYTRGGNFESQSKNAGFVFSQAPLAYIPEKRESIIAFMKTLTDDRVRYERAPFDHPELPIPHGHTGNHLIISVTNSLSDELGNDEYIIIPAVGAEGREEALSEFVDLLPQ